MPKIVLEVTVSEDEVNKYGEDGIKTLLNDILDRYGNEEYFDPDLEGQTRKEKSDQCEKVRIPMKCPECGAEPLEVRGTVIKTVTGELDGERNLITETDGEEMTEIVCVHCEQLLPLDLIKNWS